MNKMATYLDFNASTPIEESVLNTMVEVYKNDFGNADSRTHSFGDQARKIIENARQKVADLLKVNHSEVFFTSGATESDNIAILGLKEYAKSTGKTHIITTSIEHKAILNPLKQLESDGFDITYIEPDESGSIKSSDVINAIRNNTLLVSVMHANNETGIIQPVKELGEYLDNKDVFFHIDAAQSFGKLVNELISIKYDMLSLSAHKMYGPQGVGALILRKKHYRLPPIQPIMFGGSQEHGLRPGTLPTALIAGLGKASEFAINNHKQNIIGYKKNKEIILKTLLDSGVTYKINGKENLCMPNTLNISFLGVNSEALMLSSRQICGISNGSACNSGSYSPSHVLSAMGIDEERLQSAVRISWGYTPINEDDIQGLLNSVKSLQ